MKTYKVTQRSKVEYLWVVQAENSEDATDIAMSSDPENEETIANLSLNVEEIL